MVNLEKGFLEVGAQTRAGLMAGFVECVSLLQFPAI